MEFRIEKCARVIVKRGKTTCTRCDVIKFLDNKQFSTLEHGEGYTYLGVLEAGDVMQDEMTANLKKEYFCRNKKILKSKLNGGNVVRAINERAVSLIRYSAGVVECTKAELEAADRKTRKLVTIYGALHPRPKFKQAVSSKEVWWAWTD